MTVYSYERVPSTTYIGDTHEIYRQVDGGAKEIIASAPWVEDAMTIVTALNQWEQGEEGA